MTIITSDGKTMACDGMLSRGKIIMKEGCIKIVETKDGIFGASGIYAETSLFLDWCVKGRKDKIKIDDKDNEFEALFLNNDGLLFHIEKDIENHLPVQAPVAIGCGWEMASGAMLAGASPKEAVEITVRKNIYCGGKITVLTL